jgi:hypothetical protein
MDASAVTAMIADASITRTQLQIFAKYMRYDFGSPEIIPESKQVELNSIIGTHLPSIVVIGMSKK